MELVTTSVFHAGASPDLVSVDQIAIDPKIRFIAVADAPAGGEDGRAGVRIALDAVRRHLERNVDIFERFRAHPAAELRTRILEIVDECFARAAQEVFAFARRRKGLIVTLDLVLLSGNEAFVGHVGDGRVWLVRKGLVHQLTVDHSRGDEAIVFERLDEPDPRTEETAEAPQVAGGRSFTRALGPLPGVRVESLCMELMNEDRFLVGTAHLYTNIGESSLHGLFVGESLDALGAAIGRFADRKPAVGAAMQLGSGDPFKADSAKGRLAILAPMPLFAHCTERELRQVAQATRPRRFEAGTRLFNDGDAGEDLFLVISGSIRIERHQQILAVLGPGSNFGEMAMLDERTRSADAVANEDSELMVIHRDAFFALLKGNPPLAMKILWNMLLRLSSNLRSTSNKLSELSKGNG